MKTRECGGCTKCCEGWLFATIEVKGDSHPMFPGRKCHFMKKAGCSVYDSRPVEPCKTYSCVWLTDMGIPEWMKPSESGVIISWRAIKEIDEKYMEIIECGQKMPVEVLNWILHFHIKTRTNVQYRVEGGVSYLGSPKFIEMQEGVRSVKHFPVEKKEDTPIDKRPDA